MTAPAQPAVALAMSDQPGTLARIFYRFCFCFKPTPKAAEKERKVKPNDRVFNEKFKYAVSTFE